MKPTSAIIAAILATCTTLSVLQGCGGKYDKPLELDRVIRMGEYSYQDPYRGFENSVFLSISLGSLYVAFLDTIAVPPTATVRAYFSAATPIPENLVKSFRGLTRPTLVGAGERAIAVADLAGVLTVRVYGLSGGDPTVSFTDPDWSTITGLAVDATGNIYVADSANNFVRSYKPNGRARFQVDLADSGFGIGHVMGPMGLEIEGETLLIAEAHTEKVQVQRIRIDRPQTGIPFSAENPYLSVFTQEDGSEITLVRPVGVAAGERDGSVFVLDRGLGKILRFDTQGNSVAMVNSPAQDGPQDVSAAVSIDTYNPPTQTSASVYILDPIRGIIHRWDPK
jgi:sugar lactone lactonase YvrE